jgi:hypothetical protein
MPLLTLTTADTGAVPLSGTNPWQVFGNDLANTIEIAAGTTATVTGGGGTDVIKLLGGATDYTVGLEGSSAVFTHTTSGKKTYVPMNTVGDQVSFGNGTAVDLKIVAGTTPTFSLGTQALTTTSGVVTGATGTATSTPGQPFTLTAAAEVKALTAGNDTVDGATVADSINGDNIVDTSVIDTDVLNATLTANATATISNIEQINLLDKFGNVTFTATNVSGGNIKVASTYGITATVTGIDGSKGLSVEAGNNITTVVLDDVQKNPTVKLTSAVTSLALDGTATAGGTDDTVTVNMAGNTALNITKGTTMVETITLNSITGANTVTLNTGLAAADLTKITATGDKDLTIKADDVDVNGLTFVDSTTAGTTTLELIKDGAGTALDFTKLAFDKIKINEVVDANDTFQVANNANVVLAKDTTADVELKIATGATTVNVDVAATQTAGITATEFTTINLSSSATSAVSTKVIADATDTLKVSGTTDITLLEDSIGIVDATGYAGKLTVNMASTEVVKATGGNGNDTFIVSDAAIYTINGGAGSNTLKIDGDTDIKGNALDVSNIQVLNLDAMLTVNNAQITGKSWVVQDTNGATATKGLTVTMNDLVGQNLDLSTLVAGTAAATIIVTGSATANNIVGSAFGDSITGGLGVDSITGGAGADTIVTTIGVAYTTAAADKVAGFTAGAAGDILNISIANSTAIADLGVVTAGDGTTAIAGALVIKEVAKGAGATALAGTDEILLITGGTYANQAALITDLGAAAGTTAISNSAAATATNGFLVVWSDGTDAHVTAISNSEGTASAAWNTADLAGTEIVTLTGIPSITAGAFNTANFVAVA